MDKARVVVVGAGFAGLWVVRRLASEKDVEVMLLDRHNYHTFLPLLYQVAAAELEPEQIAYPLRGICRRHSNVRLAVTEVRGIDTARKLVRADGLDIPYDYLVVAAGSRTAYFGVPGAEEHSFSLKTLEEAVCLRNQIISCFEQAALESDPERRRAMLTFTVVGGGPTGVEYAGALAELVRAPLRKDFPELDMNEVRVVLLEAAPGVLGGFPERLRDYAKNRLGAMGVEVRLDASVAEVTAAGVLFASGEHLPTHTVVWTAGVRGEVVAEHMGLPLGRGGRVAVSPTLQVEGLLEVFVVGDMSLPEGQNPPMNAPNATQQGRLAAENILAMLQRRDPVPFRYRDKGAMATIGRQAAVVRMGNFAFSGFLAWLLWLFVHLAYLIGFRNRLIVLINWAWDYLFYERAVRLILPRRGCGTIDSRKREAAQGAGDADRPGATCP